VINSSEMVVSFLVLVSAFAPASRKFAPPLLLQPWRAHEACSMSAVGQVRRLTVGVEDAASCSKFYTAGLGLKTLSTSPTGSVIVGGASGPQLELRQASGCAFKPDGGFQGLSLLVPSVASALETAKACGGTVVSMPETIEHGPSWKPVEERDDERNERLEAIVADPSGYPVLLHEAEGVTAATISGARFECHAWKASQDWYEALGWTMRRYNSNVHREASLTLTVGANAEPCGPRGSTSGAVLQFMYRYGSSPVKHAGGLEAIVLDAGTRVLVGDRPTELTDPDGYVIRLEK